jgi:AraC-like DNA-binding protein
MGRAWVSERPSGYESKVVDSIDVLKRPVDGADAEIVQIGRGRIKGRLTRGTIGDLAFSKGTFSLPIRAAGVFSQTRLTLGVLLQCSSVRDISGGAALPGDIFIVPPKFDHHNVYGGPTSFAAMTIDTIELTMLFAGESALSDPGYWSCRQRCRSPDPRVALAIEPRLRSVFALLARQQTLSNGAANYFRRAIVEGFVAPLATAAGHNETSPASSPIKIVKEIEAYVDARPDRPTHISELCSFVNVSRRTLHRCFEDALGIGPSAFLRHKRLCSVHSELRRLDPQTARVTQIATEFGFIELSRFAHQYRSLFGEYPHETLHR